MATEYKNTTLCIGWKTFKNLRKLIPEKLSEEITNVICVFARTSPA